MKSIGLLLFIINEVDVFFCRNRTSHQLISILSVLVFIQNVKNMSSAHGAL